MPNRYWFIRQIEKSGRPFKVRGSNIAMLCPYHQDHRPSCNINIKKDRVALGTFHCWSCGASGAWNKLATKLKLAKLKGPEYEATPFDGLVPSLPELEKTYLPPDTIPWKGSWRGLSEQFLSQFNPRAIYDTIGETTRILFPVTINGEIQGYTSVIIPGAPVHQKSLNKEGVWIKDSLFPFDFLRGDRCALVEGVYDSLRLISFNIPTLALLGVSWDNRRRALLVQKGIKKVLLCFDGDKAGRSITDTVKRTLFGYMDVGDMDLPLYVSKLDPGNIPINMITDINRRLASL